MKKVHYVLSVFALLVLVNCQNEEVITTSARARKLDFYTDTFSAQDQGFQPQVKVKYEYDASDKLVQYAAYSRNPETQTLEMLRYFKLFYTNNLVTAIKGYLPNAETPFIEYAYQYEGNRVSKISENNHNAGVTSVANFSYDDARQKTKVAYYFSNGESFDYEFQSEGENIVMDKTTKGAQLCNAGVYSYDQHVNPFKGLGFIDYELNNLSANNKLTENVSYVGCAFPSLVAESYTYQYDEEGYPIEVTTNFTEENVKQIRLYFYK